ncbi:zinc finger protein 384-like isoform X3 [Sinocyclocheilus grahami]|uniref:zinc finger protein 384-like isoform X3 n=1 Tax=Sinocyclocheilus grahami TaxID=75366 RepID=UPI0007AC75AB|nr:PREDICTED: zinc finger protein 384-like isoform X3 [Sinocyclocheilus grahami]
MEDSHFNSSYFWSPVQGQVKEQLCQDKAPTYSHGPAHYPTTAVVAVAGGAMDTTTARTLKQEHAQPSQSSHSITVLPVPPTGIMTAAGLVTLVSPVSSAQSFFPGHPSTTMITVQTDKKNDSVPCSPVIIPLPSKRGRKKKDTLPLVGSLTGTDHLILGLSGQHHSANPYSLSPEEGHAGKEGGKTYRNHTETKPHKCPHCSKSFANTSYLAQHVRIHTGVKPYTCNYCQKTFRQLSHLQQHQRIHTGIRPYKCAHPGCEKSFTQLSNLQSHRRQHNKDKPYKCHHCNRGYVDAASLEVHLSTHTVKHDKLYSCGLCNRTYTSETYLMKHMRKHAPGMLPSPPGSNQQSHSPSHAGGSGSDRDAQSQAERSNAFIHPVGLPCIFDLNQYKPVPSADVQYKTVSVSDISPHKDLCITVEASAIQVEHLNS